MSKLVEGMIPANTECPFKSKCIPAQKSTDFCARDAAINFKFSCGLARYLDVPSRKPPTKKDETNE